MADVLSAFSAISKINPRNIAASLGDAWNPTTAGELNGFQIKLACMKGAFHWHSHPEEDEMFFVLEGMLRIKLRDGEIVLHAGEMVIIPRGVEHCPMAENEALVMLLERASTTREGSIA